MAARFDITAADDVFVGEAKNLRIKCTFKDTGLPFPLTGRVLEWYLRYAANEAVLLTKRSALGQIILASEDGTNDVAIVIIDPADTVDGAGAVLIAAGDYIHALKDVNDNAVLSYGDFALRLTASR